MSSLAIMSVLELPPRLSFSNQVKTESLYEMYSERGRLDPPTGLGDTSRPSSTFSNVGLDPVLSVLQFNKLFSAAVTHTHKHMCTHAREHNAKIFNSTNNG